MRHSGQVSGAGVAGDITTQREGELRGGPKVDLIEDSPQLHDVGVLVGDLDADDTLAGDRRFDANRRGRQGHGEVVGESFDAADLDLG